ncbi:MAG: hypothetical protein FWC91_02065 [Defluviitaleaceae bacterium]|nr:hypothetical protein [Defluviitaleaceae bacterium]
MGKWNISAIVIFILAVIILLLIGGIINLSGGSFELPRFLGTNIFFVIATSLTVSLVFFVFSKMMFSQNGSTSENGIIKSRGFRNVERLIQKSSRSGKVKLIQACAYNTNTYCNSIKLALRNNEIKVEKMEILVYKGEKYDRSVLVANINQWYQLKKEGAIENFSFEFYDFEPSIYCSLYCEKFLHWGIFKRKKAEISPFDVSTDYAVFGYDEVEDSLISEMQEFFNDIWVNHSSEDVSFIEGCLSKEDRHLI